MNDVEVDRIRAWTKPVRALGSDGHVPRTSGEVLDELQPFRVSVSPEEVPRSLRFGGVTYCRRGMMASECTVLWTHAIYLNLLRAGHADEESYKCEIVLYSIPETWMMGRSLRQWKTPSFQRRVKRRGNCCCTTRSMSLPPRSGSSKIYPVPPA
jgi:predicted glycosyltransferase